MRNDISLELASRLTEQVKTAFENGSLLDAVTPVNTRFAEVLVHGALYGRTLQELS